jgi:multiple sugar transport system substrate-binding protein
MSEDRSEEVRLYFEEAVKGWRHERRGCPVDEELAAYVGGTLRLERWLRVWWHLHAPLRRCALCRADLSALHKALLDKRELDDREIVVRAQAAERLMHEVFEIVAERAAASRRPPAELVMRKNRKRTGTRFSPVRVPGYAVAMALLGPLVFLGAWGGVRYMTPHGQESAFVEQIQSNNEKLMFHLSAIGQQLTSRLSAIDQQMTPQLTMAGNASLEEWEDFKDVVRQEAAQIEQRIEQEPVDSDLLVSIWEDRLANGIKPWDVIVVDNDTLGSLVDKGLVQPLSHDELEKVAPPDPLFQNVQGKLSIHGQYYAVPFRANVKLVFYNEDTLKEVKVDQPPETWKELTELAKKLHELASSPGSRGGRMAIQAHEGKAAAVTVYEWVKSMGGDPLTLDPEDDGVRQAFERLWNLAPYLERASTTYKFDSANKALFRNKVALVDNWTYGIKVVMGDLGKKGIKVTDRWPGSIRVLGGDVLAIPTGVPPERKERAIKLIERLVAKETQRKLAERLYWAPVRKDVYDELSAQNGYFQIIREAVETAVMRPITAKWAVAETILSEALQDVLEQGRAADGKKDPDAIKALLEPHAAKLREIAEVVRCPVVAQMPNPGDEWCKRVVSGGSLQSLAAAYQIDPDVLAKLNRRSEVALVTPESMPFGVLVPKTGPRS